MSKYTPGPWEVGDGSDRNLFCGHGDILATIPWKNARGVIARVNPGIIDHVSNARLIAASPDLADVAHMVLTTATVYTPPELVKAATEALRKAGEIPGEVGG